MTVGIVLALVGCGSLPTPGMQRGVLEEATSIVVYPANDFFYSTSVGAVSREGVGVSPLAPAYPFIVPPELRSDWPVEYLEEAIDSIAGILQEQFPDADVVASYDTPGSQDVFVPVGMSHTVVDRLNGTIYDISVSWRLFKSEDAELVFAGYGQGLDVEAPVAAVASDWFSLIDPLKDEISAAMGDWLQSVMSAPVEPLE